jgi:hypothetical protein
LQALVKAEICVPACRQAGSWQIFANKFIENICGYTVAQYTRKKTKKNSQNLLSVFNLELPLEVKE